MSKLPPKRVPPSPSKVAFRLHQIPTNDSQQRRSVYIAFKIGDRVLANDKTGTIAFIGQTKFAEGEWIGINLDEPLGKNDGSYDGVRYFEADVNHGIFCRPEKVRHLPINGSLQRTSHNYDRLSRQSAIEGASNNIFGITTIDKDDLSSTKNLQIGDRVIVRGTKFGMLRYIGKIHLDDGIWCGIKLDGPFGKHDGKVDGVRYFRCSHRFGLFAPLRHVEKVVIDRSDARYSVASAGSNYDSPIEDATLSEFSVSSDSTNHFPSRSPKFNRQKTSTTDLTPMETSLSSQVAQLLERIREKDALIRKLEQQTEKNRLEDLRTSEKINEMEKQMAQLQRKYDTTENENLNLIKEQFELKQRLDDLQDESNIPDDCCILSPEEIEIYEQTNERVLELESANEKLMQENQRLQEELTRYHQLKDNQLIKQIESLKLQITDLQNREQFVKTQLIEKEQRIQEFDQIKNEEAKIRLQLIQEKQSTERQMNELLNELKRYKESIVPDLEKQCQHHDISNGKDEDNDSLDQDANYEIELKQYQTKLDEANQQIQKLQDELKSLHDEKTSQEEELKQTIVELKRTEQQLQKDIDELNDHERKTSRTLHQHDAQLQQQMEEYETKLEQANLHNQELQLKFDKLQEENAHFNETINTIKQDLETLKIELQNRDQNATKFLLEIEHLQSKLRTVEDEKTTIENELNNTIDKLKQEFEKHQNQQELQANETLHQLEHDYQEKLEQANLKIEHLQSETENLQQFNDTIDALGQELQALKIELQDREQAHDVTINEIENHYQSQIKDLQLIENNLNEQINTLKQDYDKLQNEQKQKEKSIQARYEQEFDEYQKNLELSIHRIADMQSELVNSQEEKEANEKLLKEKIESMKIDFEKRIKIIETEKRELQEQNHAQEERLTEYDSTMNESIELFQRVEDITKDNERLKKELEDLKNECNPKDMEDLNKQVAVLQQMHLNLLEKQAIKEQEYLQDKQVQEKIFEGKIQEHEMKIALMKSEHMVEIENVKLEYDQEVLRLKAQIQKLPPSKGKK